MGYHQKIKHPQPKKTKRGKHKKSPNIKTQTLKRECRYKTTLKTRQLRHNLKSSRDQNEAPKVKEPGRPDARKTLTNGPV